MRSRKQRRAYTEVLAVLEELNLTKKVPTKLLETMIREKDESYNFIFNKNVPLEKQLLSKGGAELLSIIYLSYICNDVDEKNRLKKIYEENERKYAPKNSLEDVLDKKEEKIVEIKDIEKRLTIKKESWIDKLKKWIQLIFKI